MHSTEVERMTGLQKNVSFSVSPFPHLEKRRNFIQEQSGMQKHILTPSRKFSLEDNHATPEYLEILIYLLKKTTVVHFF